MRILMLSSFFFPESFGGVEYHLLYLAKALIQKGHHVEIVHTYLGYESSLEPTIACYDGIRVHRIGVSGWDFRWKAWDSRSLTLAAGLIRKLSVQLQYRRIATYLHEVAKEFQFDVIHQHDFVSNWLTTRCLSKDHPICLTNHTGEYLMIRSSPCGNSVLELMLNHYSAIIGPSKELSTVPAKIRDRVHYIPNGVDTSFFCPLSPQQKPHLRSHLGFSDKKVVLCPRRWAPTKGVDFLIRALPHIEKEVPNCSFVFAGNDYSAYPSYRDSCLRLLSDMGLKDVRLVGNLTPHQLRDYYWASDVVVIPSLLEATSLAALEAMACHCAVVSTDVGGMPEIIRHMESGLLVSPGSFEAITNAVVQVLRDDDLRNSLANTAGMLVESSYSWRHVANKTAVVYSSCLKR